jgi:AraC-like DNA-binding protein
LVYELFDELCKMKLAIGKSKTPEKIVRAKEMIENGYSDPLFSIEGVADALNISTTYLRREFYIAMGMSPIAYLKATRIRHAAQLLLSHDLTVKEVASKCGYSSISYFIQDFHKNMGESPSRYRARLLTAP